VKKSVAKKELSRFPIFAGLDDEQLEKIGNIISEKTMA